MSQTLHSYLNSIKLENTPLSIQGKISHDFLEKGMLTLWDAIDYVHKIPYRRTTDRENYLQVLTENRGACSVKHALIAALAIELNIPLTLNLGIFIASSENTPTLAPILKHHQIEGFPEAHCFLKHHDRSLDLTFPESSEFSFNIDLVQEMTISCEQIGQFKVQTHQEFIKEWVKNKPYLDFDQVWTAREHWIATLST